MKSKLFLPAFALALLGAACSGPKDAGYLFSRFMDMMEGNAYAQR